MITSPYAAALDAMPVARHEVEVRNTQTHYWTYGDDNGPTIVVVHGFRGDHHGLEPVIAQLPSCRLIAPDLPGFGLSAPFSQGTHDLATYAAWLTEFIEAVAPGGQAVVLGHSFGSMIVSAALAGDLSASQAILINPIAAPALEGPRGVATRLAVFYFWLGTALPERLGFALLGNRAVVRAMSILMAKTKNRELRRWIHDQHRRYFSAYASRQVVLEAFKASVSNDVSEYAPLIDIPVLLIGADRDDITSVDAQQQLESRFPDAHLVMISGVGHLIHYEAPQQAGDAIRGRL